MFRKGRLTMGVNRVSISYMRGLLCLVRTTSEDGSDHIIANLIATYHKSHEFIT